MQVTGRQVRSRATLVAFIADLTGVDTGPWQKHQRASKNRNGFVLLFWLWSLLHKSLIYWLSIPFRLVKNLNSFYHSPQRVEHGSFITVRGDAAAVDCVVFVMFSTHVGTRPCL